MPDLNKLGKSEKGPEQLAEEILGLLRKINKDNDFPFFLEEGTTFEKGIQDNEVIVKDKDGQQLGRFRCLLLDPEFSSETLNRLSDLGTEIAELSFAEGDSEEWQTVFS